MKKWYDKHGVEIQNGDLINSPQGHDLKVVFVEEWDDLGVLLTIFITPLSEDWERYKKYEIVGKSDPQTIAKESTGRMEDMPEYKRDFGKSPEQVISEI